MAKGGPAATRMVDVAIERLETGPLIEFRLEVELPAAYLQEAIREENRKLIEERARRVQGQAKSSALEHDSSTNAEEVASRDLSQSMNDKQPDS